MLPEIPLFNIFSLSFFFSIQFYHSGKREAKRKYWKGEEEEKLKSPPKTEVTFNLLLRSFWKKKKFRGSCQLTEIFLGNEVCIYLHKVWPFKQR